MPLTAPLPSRFYIPPEFMFTQKMLSTNRLGGQLFFLGGFTRRFYYPLPYRVRRRDIAVPSPLSHYDSISFRFSLSNAFFLFLPKIFFSAQEPLPAAGGRTGSPPAVVSDSSAPYCRPLCQLPPDFRTENLPTPPFPPQSDCGQHLLPRRFFYHPISTILETDVSWAPVDRGWDICLQHFLRFARGQMWMSRLVRPSRLSVPHFLHSPEFPISAAELYPY